jgi:hypothetical protein
MNYEQEIAPNLSVVGQNGECLVYVREVFGIAAKYPTATAGWENAAYKHAGDTPPSDVSVPVWFSWESAGHVAVSVPGKGIYSTTADGDKVFPTVEALAAYIGGMYLGWSEDVDGVRVVEPAAAPAPTSSNVGKNLYLSPDNTPFHAYNPNGPYLPADAKGEINPKKFGGLNYSIVEDKGNGIFVVNTADYGLSALYTAGSNVTVS